MVRDQTATLAASIGYKQTVIRTKSVAELAAKLEGQKYI